MATVYAFLADGFEEIEVFTVVDSLRRIGEDVKLVSTTPDEIVKGAHDISVLCDANFVNCDFFDAKMIFLPGGIQGVNALEKHEGLCKLIRDFMAKDRMVAAICAAPMILGKMGLLKGRKVTCYPEFEQYMIGAEYLKQNVVRDGNLITAPAAGAAMEFSLYLAELLGGKEKMEGLKEAMLVNP